MRRAESGSPERALIVSQFLLEVVGTGDSGKESLVDQAALTFAERPGAAGKADLEEKARSLLRHVAERGWSVPPGGVGSGRMRAPSESHGAKPGSWVVFALEKEGCGRSIETEGRRNISELLAEAAEDLREWAERENMDSAALKAGFALFVFGEDKGWAEAVERAEKRLEMRR